MESIGVRELRRDASRWLRRVRAGEAFVVTDRGRPVAQLGPVPPESGYAALVADGRLTQGSGRGMADVLAAMDATHPDDPTEGSLAGALAELREHER